MRDNSQKKCKTLFLSGKSWTVFFSLKKNFIIIIIDKINEYYNYRQSACLPYTHTHRNIYSNKQMLHYVVIVWVHVGLPDAII